jgi:hypothetical protein
MPAIKQNLRTRFFKYVVKTKTCWNWVGAKGHNNYGIFWEKAIGTVNISRI